MSGSRPAQDERRVPRVLGLWSTTDPNSDDAEAALQRIRAGSRQGTLRNAVVSLVVLADDDIRGAMATLDVGDRLAARVPSRVVVVSTLPDWPSGTRVSIKVGVIERSGAAPVTVEQVHLYAGGEAIAHLDAIVDPWILPGLPVAVWLPGRLPRPGEPVVADAHRVIVDSHQLGRPLDEVDLTVLSGLPAVDLAWVRLRPWRLLLADAVAGGDVSFAAGVDRIDVTGRGQAWTLLAGWLASSLGVPGSGIRLADGHPPAVHLRARRGGRRAELAAVAVDDRQVRVTTTVAGRTARQHVVGLPEESLVSDLEAALTARSGRNEMWERAAEATRLVGRPQPTRR